MEIVHDTIKDLESWYKITLNQLIEICKLVASKYTRSKVRKALPKEFSYIIDELLLHSVEGDINQEAYRIVWIPSSAFTMGMNLLLRWLP